MGRTADNRAYIRGVAICSALMIILGFLLLRAQRPSAARYESEGRDDWQKPREVIETLGLHEGMTVADIGAASGYFSRKFSPAVGENGRVLAVDIDTGALAYLASLAGEQGLTNLDTVHASAHSPNLGPASVDLVFFCNTLHHIHGRVEYLSALKEVLRPGGRVAVVDYYKRELPVGPRSLGHKVSREEALEALRSAGFEIDSEHDFLPYQYIIVASMPGE